MLEVEVKLELDASAVDRFRRRLVALGLTLGPPRHQRDTFFGHPVRDFAVTDEALRVRQVDGADPALGAAAELTYKGPKRGGAAKVREEVNVAIRGDIAALLSHLGMPARLQVDKTRHEVSDGQVHIALDVLTGVGTFVEIECMGTDEAAAGLQVEAARERLGLAADPGVRVESRSYLELAVASGAAIKV